ncbi:MAG: hypothetical protein MUE38_10940 [Flavihumibacter sp.]|nr:hypothetical protein [Flavihumibacter sp.]
MSIIQNIRDKAAWLVFIIIALSLLGFLLMDSVSGARGRGIFGGSSFRKDYSSRKTNSSSRVIPSMK